MCKWHSCLFLMIFGGISCASKYGALEYVPKYISVEELNNSLYAEDLMPPCTTEISKYYEEGVCFTVKSVSEQDDFKIIYDRFISNLKKVDESGKENKYMKAVCTLGILQSCELKKIIKDFKGGDFRINDLQYYITGEVLKFGEHSEEEEMIFPENYNPENFEEFKEVLEKSILYLRK